MFTLEDWEKEWFKDVIGTKIRELEDIQDFVLSL